MSYSKVREDFKEHTQFNIFRMYKPVCGNDGKTYSNQWELDCKGIEKQCEGECPCKDKPNCFIPK